MYTSNLNMIKMAKKQGGRNTRNTQSYLFMNRSKFYIIKMAENKMVAVLLTAK